MSSYIQHLVEGKIDFEGQKAVEKIAHNALIAVTAISFLLGLALQSLRVTFGAYGLGVTILFLTVIPAWPIFNKHPVVWLPAQETKKDK
ncbi:microsomal signal peptidase subunit [Artomyces pyxidatus]|uniref:Microsomal signal peptidase subunit n=1 Tax=Artomyces pyxidatus TaxID=48021 RepID=A0ACB8T9V0_9AGAM|nr:microsomal signal peptidase subunit [Artomyces pyxidatus]